MTVIPFPTPIDPAEALAQDVAGKMWKILETAMLDEIDTGDAVKNREAELTLSARSLELLILLVSQDLIAQQNIDGQPSMSSVWTNYSMITRVLHKLGEKRLRQAKQAGR